MGWKSVSPPAMASLPFHAGLARSMADFGSWLAVSSLVLYTSTLTRAEIPTHPPWGEFNREGVLANVDGAIGRQQALRGQELQGR